jgi:hypothetical protein
MTTSGGDPVDRLARTIRVAHPPCRIAVLAAARFLAALGRATHDAAFRARAERTLAAVLTPEALEHQGSWLGAVLLALDDIGAVPWPNQAGT